MASHPSPVITVALPVPLRRAFDYSADGQPVPAGCRVQVSFNRRLQVGVALGSGTASASGTGVELKPILQRLDTAPLLNHDTLALLRWAADYYLHSATRGHRLPVGRIVEGAAQRHRQCDGDDRAGVRCHQVVRRIKAVSYTHLRAHET